MFLMRTKFARRYIADQQAQSDETVKPIHPHVDEQSATASDESAEAS